MMSLAKLLRGAKPVHLKHSIRGHANGDSGKPMSVVLGWAFAQPHQVSKFGRLHRRVMPEGSAVTEYTLEVPHFFTFNQPVQAEATDRLLDKMRAEAGVDEKYVWVL